MNGSALATAWGSAMEEPPKCNESPKTMHLMWLGFFAPGDELVYIFNPGECILVNTPMVRACAVAGKPFGE